MPKLRKGKLSEPLSTAFDGSLSFKCPRDMVSAVEMLTKEMVITRSDFLRTAVNHAVRLELEDLEGDVKVNLEKLVIVYQEELYKEDSRRFQEYEQELIKFLVGMTKGRKLYEEDYVRLARCKEYIERTKVRDRPSTEELHNRWEKFCKTKRGRQILDEIEKRRSK